jgi:1-deoxy-D-xylulose-5-phosphate synthase
MPNMSIIAPRDENMLRHALCTGLDFDGPLAVRYPRDKGRGLSPEAPRCLPWGRGELLRSGEDVAILAVGTLVHLALAAAERLSFLGLSAAVVDPVFVKPLDETLLREVAGSVRYGLLTLEEHTLPGGFGSAILELLAGSGTLGRPLLRQGIPDHFVGHGPRETLLAELGLTVDAVAKTCLQLAGEKKDAGP